MFNDAEIPSLFDPDKDIAAVFIDFENMRITVEETGGEPFQINKVLAYVDQNIGRVAIKKAYSNWHYVNPHMFNLLGNNTDLVQIYTRGTQRKNAADIRLTADAMETVFLHPHVTTFVIVACDSDYTGLIINLRKYNKKVVGIGTRQHVSEHLVQACNLFRFYRTIAADDPATLKQELGEIDLQEAKELLVRAMLRHRFTDRPAVGRWLRWQMIQLAPSFDERDYGFANFREFLEACRDVVRVEFDERFQETKVELLPEASALAMAGKPPDEFESPGPVGPPREERPRPARSFDEGPSAFSRESDDDLSFSGGSHYHFDETMPPTIPTYKKPEDVKRSDYLRTLWGPKIYLYPRAVSAPLIREILRVNGPGKQLSEYELEEYLLGTFLESFTASLDAPHYEINQKTVYAVQKLLFWANVIKFLDEDELLFWKKRKREILVEYADEKALFEQIDLQLARHFARYLPLVPEVLATVLQGSDSLEYAKKIAARAS